MNAGHESGCDTHHTPRQRCNGPVAEARHAATRSESAISLASPPSSQGSDAQESLTWLAVGLELLPGVAAAVGALPGADAVLILAFFGGIGWFVPRTSWRRFGIGCSLQVARGLIWLALFAAALAAFSTNIGAPCGPMNVPDIGGQIDDCYQKAQYAVYVLAGILCVLSVASAWAVLSTRRRDRLLFGDPSNSSDGAVAG